MQEEGKEGQRESSALLHWAWATCFESLVHAFYELTTSHCVENPPRCQGSAAFRMSLLITFPSEI